jgi:hypothetical protein
VFLSALQSSFSTFVAYLEEEEAEEAEEHHITSTAFLIAWRLES